MALPLGLSFLALVQIILILLLIIGIIFIIALIIEFIIVLTSKRLGSPFIPTRRKFFSRIRQALDLNKGDALYELGSGTGDFLLSCARESPNIECVGIERNPFLFSYAQMRKRFAGNPKNLTFVLGDFFKADLSRASHIYGYLLPGVMDLLLPKLERESRKLRIASRAFPFKEREPTEIVELSEKRGLHDQHLLYVYEFRKT